MNYADIELDERIRRGIDEVGFQDWTPVQHSTLSLTLGGKDVLVQSKTGTGKTAAFLISIFQLMLTGKKNRALILAPTRELAVQIEKEANLLGKYCGLVTGCFYGGMGYHLQEQKLRENVQIFIGTPGRLIDFIKSGKIDARKMDMVVIDEADRMFDMGFIKDIQYILRKCPNVNERLTLLFSATLSYQVKKLSWDLMKEPEEILIEPEVLTADNITQEIYHVSRREKFRVLLGLLKKEDPATCLVFTNTKRQAEYISMKLEGNGVNATYISGDLPQKKRLSIIDGIKEGKYKVIVATDVAARGLHIDDLSLVVNYDLPDDPTSYVHRIGRTARAGKSGKAVSLACEEYIFNLDPIEKKIERRIPEIQFDDSMLVEDVSKPVRTTQRPHRKPEGGRIGAPHHTFRSNASVSTRANSPARREPKLAIPSAAVATPESGQTHISRVPSKPRPIPKPEFRTQKPAEPRPEFKKPAPIPQPEKLNSAREMKIPAKITRHMPLEQRIAFYEKKYGKDFVYRRKKRGILGSLLGWLGLGKK